MIIVAIKGGLGNQMFQFALYLKYKAMGKEVYIDDQIFTSGLNDPKALKICDVFSLDYQMCSKRLSHQMADADISILHRIRRKFFGKKELCTHYIENDLDNNYHPEILEFNNMYLDGFWQSEKYFEDIKDEIFKNYMFSIEEHEMKKYLSGIRNTNSVSIHIRRGDYIGNSGYDEICTESYYKKAISYIKKNIDNPVFYIFSDDVEYVKEKYRNENMVIIDQYSGAKSHYDMYLMTQCKHNIVANSSFSWWGAWLNQNEDKIIVCPKRWSPKWELKHTICEDWIRL